ncbi:hypothetical protein OIO90_002546 [Microbotryomycetes sp. JL221]|nr:hypothetical protein OIO90_002546 [Microbotryomycetes sp. JL221]
MVHPQERSKDPVEPDLFDMALPPSGDVEETVLQAPPHVLADRLLHLHSEPAHSPQSLDHVTQEDRPSWLSMLSNRKSSSRRSHDDNKFALDRDENETLLDDSDQASDVSDHDYSIRSRGSKRRSKSRSSRGSASGDDDLPWYKRPSPVLMLPGTLIMTLSMTATASPKLEIYYQLICKAIGPEGGVLAPPSHSPDQPVTLPPTNPDQRPLPTNPDQRPLPPFNSSVLDDSETNLVVDNFVRQALRRHAVEAPGSDDSDLPPSEPTIPIPPSKRTTSRWKLVIDGSEDDASWTKRCHKSPEVSRAVTQLNTLLSFIMGCLSALTTGWWGSVSDRFGRKPVLVAALVGLNLMDIVFLITVTFHDVVGYRFLFLGPILDGLLGGYATAQATGNAYLSDCTDAGSRARIFSVIGGMAFLGIFAGPMLGAWMIRRTGNVLAPFFLALALHLCYLAVAGLGFPESLSKARQMEARERHRIELERRAEEDKEEDEVAKSIGYSRIWLLRAKRYALRPWSFLKPLKMLLPRERSIDEAEEDRPIIDTFGRVTTGWDFSLVKIGIAAGCYGLAMAIIAFKLLYASNVFDWGYEQNGLFLSFLGGCRVVVLIVLLPLSIKLLRKPPPKPSRPRPQHDTAGDPNDVSDEQKAWDKEETWLRVVHDSRFDLVLARFSIVVDILGYVGLALNGGSSTRFLLFTAFSCLGGGAMPAIQSLALAHASHRDAGRLFASLSVLSSVMSSVIGPLLFGSIFMSTIASAPETVFWAGAAVFTVALLSVMTIRLRRASVDEIEEGHGVGLHAPHDDDELPPREVSTKGGHARSRSTRHQESAFSLRTVHDERD